MTRDQAGKSVNAYFARSVAAAHSGWGYVPAPKQPTDAETLSKYERLADAIMAQIEHDGADHRSSIIDTIATASLIETVASIADQKPTPSSGA